MNKHKLVTVALLTASALCAGAFTLSLRAPQSVAPSTTPAVQTPLNLTGPPEPVLYRLFFQSTLAFGRLAAKREAAGKDASGLRSYFVSHAGLNDGQNGAVFQVALEDQEADAALLSQQRQLITDWRAQAHAAVVNGLAPPAPPMAQLKQIQEARDALAMQERQQLQTLLGDDGFEKLEVYVHQHFGKARHLTLPVPSEFQTNGGGGQ